MKNLNENDFVMIENGLAVCVKKSKYEDFNIKEGMVIVDKSIAITSFELCDGTELGTESDVIISYANKTNDYFVGWVKKYGKWEKIYFSVLHENRDLYLRSIVAISGNEIAVRVFKELLSRQNNVK